MRAHLLILKTLLIQRELRNLLIKHAVQHHKCMPANNSSILPRDPLSRFYKYLWLIGYSIVFIAGIIPTNYSISYIVQNSTHSLRASQATAIKFYDNKLSDCLLSRSQKLIAAAD